MVLSKVGNLVLRLDLGFEFWLVIELMINKCYGLSPSGGLCLVLLQVPKCFGLVQFYCARPKIYLHIVAVTKILWQTKRWFVFSKIGFCASTNVFEEGLNAVKFLGWHKIFGPAQNILGPVKGQGISQPKNLTACSASSKSFVPAQKPILLNTNHLFVWHKMSVTATICK